GAYLDQLDDFLDHVGGFRTERHELSELLSEAAPPAMVAGEGVFAAGTLRHALAMGLALWGSPS
ncbi:MAG: hypothetical protein KC466_15480, partial [Myxococcales bacterium]|nr:hypothetical protein [Myxococcales bacterium]